MTNAEAWFNNSLRPRKPEGSLGRTAQDGHLDSHTAPELWLQGDESVWGNDKLHALVHDILPSTSAIVGYAIGLEKLSANGQFFVLFLSVVVGGAQMAVSL